MKSYDALIVGAGMTGIAAGLTLQELGLSNLLLERNPYVGGRMATQEISGNSYDSGAQYIQPSPRFLRWIKKHTPPESIQGWEFKSTHKTYTVPSGMRSLAESLAQPLSLQTETQIQSLQHGTEGWTLRDSQQRTYSAKRVLITLPLPQALDLLQKNDLPIENTDLQELKYRSCLAVLISTEELQNFPSSEAMFIKNPVLEWVCNNSKKGFKNNSTAITIHCSENFSEEKYDLSDEKIFELVYTEFSKYFPNKLTHYAVQKWKYSSPKKGYYSSLYYRTPYPGLYLSGDAFGGNSLDGAHRAGIATAHVIKDDVLV